MPPRLTTGRQRGCVLVLVVPPGPLHPPWEQAAASASVLGVEDRQRDHRAMAMTMPTSAAASFSVVGLDTKRVSTVEEYDNPVVSTVEAGRCTHR